MYFIYYYLISLSILGYGYFFSSKLRFNTNNLGIIGLNGIFVLILISYLTTFFFTHSKIFNSTVLLFGLSLLFFYTKKKNNFNFFLHFLVFFILFIFILSGKNHDDFPYYHFPYTHILTQFNHPVGLGLINNGFRNPSSLFYLNSLFYLPKIEFYLYHLGSVFFLGYANLFFIKNIFNKDFFKKNKFFNLINLIFFIFTNIIFYRLSEYGTDKAGQILVIIIFIILIFVLNNKSKNNDNYMLFKSLIVLGCITISLKPFYLIYSSFLIYFILNDQIRYFLGKFIKSKFLFIVLFYLCFSFLITFLNSGCLIFPASFTCFENFSWSVPQKEVVDVKIWYELWSKAGATPNYVVDNRLEYISNFNWFLNWIDNYFFNKFSDYILSLLLISLIFFLVFKFKNKKIIKVKNRENRIIYLFLFFFTIEWFLYHPTLRYGGYHLFALITFIPLIFYVERIDFDWNFFFKRSIILIFITVLIFVSRNIVRLQKEYKVYDYNFVKDTKYKFINNDLDFYLRYNKIIENKDFNYEYKNIIGKNILIIKK